MIPPNNTEPDGSALVIPSNLLRLPTKEEAERARAFRVHMHYLLSIAGFIKDTYGSDSEMSQRLVSAQRVLPGFARIQSRKPPEPGNVARFLTISFASELQLQLAASSNPSVVRYSNVWAPVHAYYAVYMALQAWFSMNAMSGLADDHTSSLKTISNMVEQRKLLPLPWCVCCRGCPQLGDPSFLQAPSDEDLLGHIEVLSAPTAETFWQRYGMLLSTTRKRRLERNFAEWKKDRGRKAMKRSEKTQLAQNLAATTLFDFFWRIRVRANYRDVNSFLTWNVSDFDHRAYFDSLLVVVDATTTLVQSLAVKSGARGLFQAEASSFLKEHKDNTGKALEFLDRRLKLLAPVL